jgi:hypothetical protein
MVELKVLTLLGRWYTFSTFYIYVVKFSYVFKNSLQAFSGVFLVSHAVFDSSCIEPLL